MSIYFNQLLLNDEKWDKHPRSWICVNGKGIKEIISTIEKGIIEERATNREQVSRLIAKRLNCNYGLIKRLLQRNIKFYPIPIVLKLCELSNKEKFYKKLLEKSIENLKVNSASSKPIKAVKELKEELAKIIGAFCADGSLSIQFVISSKNKEDLLKYNGLGEIRISNSRKEYYIAIQVNRENYDKIREYSKSNNELRTQTHYTIELTDEYKSNVEAFNKWILNVFGIKPISFYQRDLAWRTIFSNKILARYLIKFFSFLPGYKSDIVSEPEIIKNSEFKIRKEFAKGVIMFDGCITKRKTIAFSTNSRNLANSIKEILTKDNLKVGSFLNKRKEYMIYTFANENTKKLLEYFEGDTKKWELLKWLTDEGFKSNQIIFEKDFKNTKNVYELLKEIKVADANIIKKKLNCSFITARNHLIILKNKGMIKLGNKPLTINKFVSDRITILLKQEFHNKIFNWLFERFKTYTNASKFLEINKATLSSWKVRKNRIPLYSINNICHLLGIPQDEIYNNIEETDREIAEII